MEEVKKKLMLLSGRVEESVRKAVACVQERDAAGAKHLIEKDYEIDNMEVSTEEECLKILALHQPVAVDLRFLIAVIKINNDLERIGDLAVNVAERAVFLSEQKDKNIPFDFPSMAAKVQKMLTDSLDALVGMDADLAQKVCAADDEVDDMNRQMYELVKKAVVSSPEDVSIYIHMLGISRHLERIADLATNIAEDVMYMVTGDIARHRTEDYSTK